MGLVRLCKKIKSNPIGLWVSLESSCPNLATAEKSARFRLQSLFDLIMQI